MGERRIVPGSREYASPSAARLLALLAVILSCTRAAAAPVAVTMSQYEAARTAANLAETVLTPTTVNPAQFGRLFTREVDDAVYAEPLIVPGVVIDGAPRTLLLVATMSNTVYAFDADDAARRRPYWARSLGPPGDTYGRMIGPLRWGILGTPCADRATGTVYVVARTKAGDDHELWLHALALADGEDRYHSPQRLSFPFAAGETLTSVGSAIQRAGLLITDGVLVIAFANIMPTPEHDSQEGFLQSFAATDLRQRLATFQTTPTGLKGGIWQAGRGIAADGRGAVFVATAGGSYDGESNFGSSILKLDARTLRVVDWFTPADHERLFRDNLDPSANGVTLIPNSSLLFAGGKDGVVYLLDQNGMGRLEGTNGGPLERFRATVGCGDRDCMQTLGTAYWTRGTEGLLYVWDRGDRLRGYRFAAGRFETTPFSVSAFTPMMTGGPTVSANGDDLDSGIVWAVTTDADATLSLAPGTLRAFAASDLRPLYASDANPERDAPGLFTKFALPVVANGKVYVPTHSQRISVYGLLPAP